MVHNECGLRCARCYYGIKSTIGSVVDGIKSSKGIYLEDGTLVGHLLPDIDGELVRSQKL